MMRRDREKKSRLMRMTRIQVVAAANTYLHHESQVRGWFLID